MFNLWKSKDPCCAITPLCMRQMWTPYPLIYSGVARSHLHHLSFSDNSQNIYTIIRYPFCEADLAQESYWLDQITSAPASVEPGPLCLWANGLSVAAHGSTHHFQFYLGNLINVTTLGFIILLFVFFPSIHFKSVLNTMVWRILAGKMGGQVSQRVALLNIIILINTFLQILNTLHLLVDLNYMCCQNHRFIK